MTSVTAAAVDPIETLLDQALIQDRDRRDHARLEAKGGVMDRTHLYVSEVGTVAGESACWRRLFYSFKDAPRAPLPVETLLAFAIGDVIGLRLANILAASGGVEKVELPVRFENAPVSGRLDILVSKDRRVIEVKSATVKQWNYLPKQDHLDQALLYVHALRQQPAYADVSEAAVLYVAKDSVKDRPVRKAFAVRYDESRAMDLLELFRLAFGAATGTAVPSRPLGFTPSKFPCSYCPWATTTCWSGHDA